MPTFKSLRIAMACSTNSRGIGQHFEAQKTAESSRGKVCVLEAALDLVDISSCDIAPLFTANPWMGAETVPVGLGLYIGRCRPEAGDEGTDERPCKSIPLCAMYSAASSSRAVDPPSATSFSIREKQIGTTHHPRKSAVARKLEELLTLRMFPLSSMSSGSMSFLQNAFDACLDLMHPQMQLATVKMFGRS